MGAQLDLSTVVQVSSASGFLSSFSPCLHIVLKGGGDRLLKINFPARYDLGVCKQLLQSTIDQQMESVSLSEDKEQPAVSLQYVGIHGIIQRQEKDLRKSEQEIENAFADLKSLMSKAKEMVALVDTFSKRLRAHEGGGQAEEECLAQMAVRLGLQLGGAAPRGHTETAQQLAACLGPLLERSGGMLILQDAYCLANRARGTVLLSPEDMLQACQLFAPLGLPLRFLELPSGVKVVQTAAYSLDEVGAVVRSMLGARPFLTATDLAVQRGHSAVLCGEQLLALERAAVLCRDDSEHGLLFYLNKF